MSTPHTPKGATKEARSLWEENEVEEHLDRLCGWLQDLPSAEGKPFTKNDRINATGFIEDLIQERAALQAENGELRDERDRLQEQRDKLWERLTEGVDTVAVKARLLALAEAVLTDDWVCERCGWSANPDLSGPKPGPPQAPMNPTQRHA